MLRNISTTRIGLSLFAAAFTMAAVGCLGGSSSTDEETGVDNTGAAASCSSSAWQQGAWYTTGTVVTFNGASYVAEHDNPGYDPTISTWFWDPHPGCGGGTTPPPGGGSCNLPQWQAGAWYTAGTKVNFNGTAYVAEHDNPGYDPTISTWFWDPAGSCGGGTVDPPPPPPPPGGGFASIISEAQFNSMFPNRNGFYTHQALAAAAATFNGFATTGDTDTRKREVAAFLANVAHETGNLVYTEEINKADYCDTGWGPPGCGCAPGKRYFGRGPIQLSWNGNYCAAGNALGLDLKNDPDLVARDATVAWRTGLWFWNTQNGAGNMTAHDAMVNNRGFGETIRTINGALECGGRRPDQVNSRIESYTRFTGILGVSPGGNLGC